MSVTIFGSANMDLVVQVPRIPEAGETLTGSAFTLGLGGKGSNQAVAAARLGANTAFVGRVGDDAYGTAVREGLLSAGVDIAALNRDATAATGVALVVVADNGENTIIVVPGANGAVDSHDLQNLGHRLAGGGVLLVQLELPMPMVVAAVVAAGQHRVRVILDPAPAPAGGLPAELYAPHVILTPNESEAAALVGYGLDTDAAAERAARTLLERGVSAVVLKLGERGICWAQDGDVGWAPALPVVVRDTVGAGDAVNGALGVALDEGSPFPEAVRWAVAAGAVAVTRAGAFAAMPTRAEVLAQLEPSVG